MRLADTLLQHCLYNSDTGLSIAPDYDFGMTQHEYEKRLKAVRNGLDRQQQLLWIRNSLRGLNPQGVRVSDFQKPSDSQRQENFLARYRQHLPAAGGLTVFNRTPYEGLVSDLADGYIDDNQAAGRLQQLLEFEANLAEQGIHLLKIYLHISKAEQKNRLRQRFINPEKHWKISAADLAGHQNFHAIEKNWNQAFKQSSTLSHPWHIVPANNKPLRNLLFCSLIAQKFEEMDLQWPQPELPFSLETLDQSCPPVD